MSSQVRLTLCRPGRKNAGLSQKSSGASGTYRQPLVTEMKKPRAVYPSQKWIITQNAKRQRD